MISQALRETLLNPRSNAICHPPIFLVSSRLSPSRLEDTMLQEGGVAFRIHASCRIHVGGLNI